MPFSRYAVDPDLMEVMREAFHRVCDILQLSCDREDPLTEFVVTKIVELAKAGERDPEVFRALTCSRLETQSEGVTSRASFEPRTPVSSAKESGLGLNLLRSGHVGPISPNRAPPSPQTYLAVARPNRATTSAAAGSCFRARP